MSSKAKLILALLTVLLLTSCGEFGGFSDFKKADTGSITKVEAYFTEENLAKFYDSVSQPEEDYAQCTVSFSRNFGKEAALFAGIRNVTGDCTGNNLYPDDKEGCD